MYLSKNLLVYLCTVAAAYGASVGIGAYRITTSDAFPIAKSALTGYLTSVNSKDASKPPYFKWWRFWYFNNSYSSGYVYFLLCTSSKQCYPINSYRNNGNWATKINGMWIVSTSKNGETITNIDGKWFASTTQNGETITNIDGKWFGSGDDKTQVAPKKSDF